MLLLQRCCLFIFCCFLFVFIPHIHIWGFFRFSHNKLLYDIRGSLLVTQSTVWQGLSCDVNLVAPMRGRPAPHGIICCFFFTRRLVCLEVTDKNDSCCPHKQTIAFCVFWACYTVMSSTTLNAQSWVDFDGILMLFYQLGKRNHPESDSNTLFL